jgi:hypothetical protein
VVLRTCCWDIVKVARGSSNPVAQRVSILETRKLQGSPADAAGPSVVPDTLSPCGTRPNEETL